MLTSETGALRGRTGTLRAQTSTLRARTGGLRVRSGGLRGRGGGLRGPTGGLRSRIDALRDGGATVRAVLTNGRGGLSGDEMALLPNLEIACAVCAGYEAIDLDFRLTYLHDCWSDADLELHDLCFAKLFPRLATIMTAAVWTELCSPS